MATFAVVSSFCCLCLSVRNWGTDYAEGSCMFKRHALECTDVFHIRCVTGQRHQNGSSWIFIDEFTNFLHVYVCATCRWMAWMLTIINQSFQMFELRKPLKNLLFPWHCHQQLFWVFHAFPMQCSRAVSKLSCNCIVQPLEKHGLLLTWTKISTHRKAVQRVMAAKLTGLTQKVVIL
jgi:hypothetical protein